MTYRVGPRPTFAQPRAYPPTKTYSTSGPRRARAMGYSTEDLVTEVRRGLKRLDKLPAPAQPPSLAKAQKAKRQAETAANQGYRGGFVMMNLDHTEAHARRKAAIADIWGDNDKYEAQGRGFLHQGERVDASESHISVIRGIRAKMLHPDEVGMEGPAKGHLDAFEAVRKQGAATLALGDLKYWVGPAFGPPKYVVAAIEVLDPQDAMGKMRAAWAGAHGTMIPPTKDVPMHLTLAYLKLGTDRLPAEVEAKVMRSMRGGGAANLTWKQDDVHYSGRYGATFAEGKLQGE